MTTKSRMTPRLAGAALGALVLVAAMPARVPAEQVDGAGATVRADQTARPPAKPQKPVQRTVRAQDLRTQDLRAQETPNTPNRPWALEDALPNNSAAMRRQYEPPASPGLGRLPVRSGSGTGSFGFETETKVKPNQLPDGRTIPGLEAATSAHPNSTYWGLSLSVPTTGDKSLIPTPP